jgi:hypothetical protein
MGSNSNAGNRSTNAGNLALDYAMRHGYRWRHVVPVLRGPVASSGVHLRTVHLRTSHRVHHIAMRSSVRRRPSTESSERELHDVLLTFPSFKEGSPSRGGDSPLDIPRSDFDPGGVKPLTHGAGMVGGGERLP